MRFDPMAHEEGGRGFVDDGIERDDEMVVYDEIAEVGPEMWDELAKLPPNKIIRPEDRMSTFEPAMTGKLTDRLRGKYPIGPMLPNGEPEFGWRQFDPSILPPIQIEAADAIEAISASLIRIAESISNARERGECRDGILDEVETSIEKVLRMAE